MPPIPGVAPSVELVVRYIRHEVGDLLQNVYASVAVLSDQLPAAAKLERTILADLNTRAEKTRHLLDTIHDLIRTPKLETCAVDLTELVTSLIAADPADYSTGIRTELGNVPEVQGDAKRLTQLGDLMVRYASEMARGPLTVRVAGVEGSRQVAWSVAAGGGTIPEDHLAAGGDPFGRPDPGGSRLKLALAARLTELHGGDFSVLNHQTDGFELRVVLPVARSEPS